VGSSVAADNASLHPAWNTVIEAIAKKLAISLMS
jgi:hypothetical protein